MPEFKPVNSEDRFLYELMPILIGIGPNGDILSYGSCFIASPHMAITAKHVVEELLKQEIALGNPCKYEYWVVQIIWNGNQHSYVVWAIDTIATSPHSDIQLFGSGG